MTEAQESMCAWVKYLGSEYDSILQPKMMCALLGKLITLAVLDILELLQAEVVYSPRRRKFAIQCHE